MRISDCSSDVCSSDLHPAFHRPRPPPCPSRRAVAGAGWLGADLLRRDRRVAGNRFHHRRTLTMRYKTVKTANEAAISGVTVEFEHHDKTLRGVRLTDAEGNVVLIQAGES